MGKPAGPGNAVASVMRALRIIDHLGAAERDLGVTEIARQLNLTKSTAFRLLATLVALGYVRQDPETEKYRLGLYLAELGSKALDRLDLRREAYPFLTALVGNVEETVHLGILDRQQVVYIDKVESGQLLSMKSRVGARVPSYCTALGKVLLAFQEREELEGMIASEDFVRFTPNTITNPKAFREHLGRIHEQGYAVDDEEHELGIRCVAAPVRDHAGKVVAAISVSGPSLRMTRERLDRIIPALTRTAEEVSHAMGYRPGGKAGEACTG